MDIILGLAVVSVFCFIFYKYMKTTSYDVGEEWKEIDEKKEEEPSEYRVVEDVPSEATGKIVESVPEDAFVFVRYRDVVFSMRKHEKTEIWDRMNRSQRNEQLEAQKKAVKKGLIKEVVLEEGVVCYLPVQGSLKDLQKNYADWKNLGGKLEG